MMDITNLLEKQLTEFFTDIIKDLEHKLIQWKNFENDKKNSIFFICDELKEQDLKFINSLEKLIKDKQSLLPHSTSALFSEGFLAVEESNEKHILELIAELKEVLSKF